MQQNEVLTLNKTKMEGIGQKNYPSIAQSFGIAGIVVLSMIVFLPVKMLSQKIFPDGAALLFNYLLTMGVPLGVAYLFRKKISGETSFSLGIGNVRILPFVVLAMTALGLPSPLGNDSMVSIKAAGLLPSV